MSGLQERIGQLISQRAINIETNEGSRVRYRGSRIVPLSKNSEPRIVVGKDESKKELILHLTYLVDEDRSLYINHLKLKGSIKDYDLKEEYSIFTYLGNFKSTTLGTEIFAQVRNIVTNNNQKCYEMTLKYKKAQDSHFDPGIIRDQVEITERDWKIYSKYGCFSGSFLAQYEENFANPGLFHRYSKDLRLKENESLNQDSLIPYLEGLSLDFQRILSGMKQSSWTDKHFMEGLKCLKSNKPDLALEHLTLAKSFDKKSSKIFIARGCALANLNNLSDGLREIKEALRLSPNNKEALGYLEKIRKEMKGKEVKEEGMEPQHPDEGSKKIRLNNNMEPLRKR